MLYFRKKKNKNHIIALQPLIFLLKKLILKGNSVAL